jgi:hypothetical protein
VTYDGDDPWGKANVLNNYRTSTAAQRAMTAAKQWIARDPDGDTTRKRGRPKKDENRPPGGFSREDLARQFRVGNASISHARDLLLEAPDLADEVATNPVLALSELYGQLEERRELAAQQAEPLGVAAQFAPRSTLRPGPLLDRAA